MQEGFASSIARRVINMEPDGWQYTGEVKDRYMDTEKLSELRNYHVKKLLNHLGGGEVAPYLQKAIKRSYSEFAEDIIKGQTHGTEETLPNGNH